METLNFWDFDAWGCINIIGALLVSLLLANILKERLKFLQKSLIPTSVLAGVILLVISNVWKPLFGANLFETNLFSARGLSGISILEVITYHALAIGFIAQTLKQSDAKLTKKRSVEIFNTGVTTVSTYLLQGILGLGITLLTAFIVADFFPASGVLLPFGYGQGSGQALNYGNLYEVEYGFIGGKSFGLSIAALGFLSASLGGVIHLNIMKKKGRLKLNENAKDFVTVDQITNDEEIPVNGAIDKLTVQIALIVATYMLTYGIMYLLGDLLLPSMQATVYGFNFLFGVLMATLVKGVLSFLNKKKVVKKKYTNNFMLTRISNLAFDVMIVAGIAAIQLDALKNYWHVLLILGIVGLIATYLYNIIITKIFFKDYMDEQFLVMFGMLTGTASTGVMLLREIDPNYKTPASDNLVYQNFPAIVFGFPMMLLATLAPKEPVLTFLILVCFFIVMNIILFRSKIFRRKNKLSDKV